MRNIVALWSVGFCALVTVSSCGGGGTCGVAAPCGGDILGNWNITSTCVTVKVMNAIPECPAATGESVDLKMTGSIEFRADMTYSSQNTISGKVRVTLPADCLMGATCAQLQEALNDPAMPTTCANAGSGCACTVTRAPETTTETGTYTTTAAGVLTQTPAGSTPDTSNYCVKGTTLTISSEESMMGQQASGTITLSKQ